MDSKNVIAAISLSAAVIILYSLFFQPEPEIIKQNLEEKKQIEKNSEAPSLDQNENFSKITRKEALEKDKRIKFENENIVEKTTIGRIIIAKADQIDIFVIPHLTGTRVSDKNMEKMKKLFADFIASNGC
jgi:hypothetical protein